MEIKVKLTRKDYFEFNKYYMLKKKIKRKAVYYLFILFAVMIAFNLNKPFNIYAIIEELVLFLFIYALILLFAYFIFIIIIKMIPDKKGDILSEKTYIFSDDGLKQISENNESYTKWNGILSIENNKKYIYLFVDSVSAYIIPTRIFKSDKDLNELMNFLNTKRQK